MTDYKVKLNISKIDIKKFKQLNARSYDSKKKIIPNLIAINKLDLQNEGKILCGENDHSLAYKFSSEPTWYEDIKGVFGITQWQEELSNQSTGAVAYFSKNGTVFAVTCGRGKDLIKSYIVKNYGQEFLTKFFNETDLCFNGMTKSNIFGNEASSSISYKNPSNAQREIGNGDYVTGVSARMISGDLETLIPNCKREAKLECRDSLSISTKFNKTEMDNLLINLEKMEKVSRRFLLGFFNKISKQEPYNNQLINDIFEDKSDISFAPAGNYMLDYYTSDTFRILNENSIECLRKNTKIKSEDILGLMKGENGKLSKKKIKEVLKYTIVTENEDDITVNNVTVKECLQAKVELD